MKRGRAGSKELRSAPIVSPALLICIALGVTVLAVYARVVSCDFVSFDDTYYVRDNKFVNPGLTWKGFVWAFTHVYSSNWHPLTWLSHMLDCEFYGIKPGGHHFTSVLIHCANSIILFAVLRRLTAGMWRSAFVAVLFALHPLHAESVAWVAERKDVLCAFFFFLTLWAWHGHLRFTNGRAVSSIKPKPRPNSLLASRSLLPPFYSLTSKLYFLSLLLFSLSLMSKPMAVTLPFVLLLLDYWPLRRIGWSTLGDFSRSLVRLMAEKLPFFMLSLASAVVTVNAQTKALAALNVGLADRIANALVAYARYVRKLFWPSDLCVFYPHPLGWPTGTVILAAALLLLVSALAVLSVRRRPYLFVGWFWFLGTLVPVIGILQVGMQSMADRYAYIPLIGLGIMLAWGGGDLVADSVGRRRILTTAAIAGFVICALLTWRQIGYWQNNIALYSRALAVTTDNALAHNSLGSAWGDQERSAEAVFHYKEALRIQPDYALAHNNYGYYLAAEGKMDEAIVHFQAALETDPRYASAMVNLGNALATQGKLDEAIERFLAALKIEPENADVEANLGTALSQKGNLMDAARYFRASLEHEPRGAPAHYNFGMLLVRMGKLDEARLHFSETLRLNPRHPEAVKRLQEITQRSGR